MNKLVMKLVVLLVFICTFNTAWAVVLYLVYRGGGIIAVLLQPLEGLKHVGSFGISTIDSGKKLHWGIVVKLSLLFKLMPNVNVYQINPPTFGTFFIQVDAPFETIRYRGFEWWNNCEQCWFPKWFWMVGQLIQNLVWIFPNCSTANTKPCLDTGESMDPLKPFEWIWMVVQLATNTVQMVSPCVYKTNAHFLKWKFWMVSNGLSVGGSNGLSVGGLIEIVNKRLCISFWNIFKILQQHDHHCICSWN